MAKKLITRDTPPEVPVVEVDRPASRPKVNYTAVKDRTYHFNSLDKRQLKALNRLAPQAKALVKLLNPDNVNKTMSEQQIFDLVMEEQEVFNSRQHPWRIFQYYRSALINRDFFIVS